MTFMALAFENHAYGIGRFAEYLGDLSLACPRASEQHDKVVVGDFLRALEQLRGKEAVIDFELNDHVVERRACVGSVTHQGDFLPDSTYAP